MRRLSKADSKPPKHLARTVHDLYFEPTYEAFRPRTIWSLSNSFTSAFKELEPIPQFKATAKLGEFLEARFSQSFLACREVLGGPPQLVRTCQWWILLGWLRRNR